MENSIGATFYNKVIINSFVTSTDGTSMVDIYNLATP